MQGIQKTPDCFSERDTTELEEYRRAQSMTPMENVDRVTYDNLMEDVLEDENIKRALERVVGNKGAPGIDGMSVSEPQGLLPANIEGLKVKVRSGKYRPSPVVRAGILKPDGGEWTLGVPTVVDRLIQQAVAQVLTPIYEPLFSDSGFGFRPTGVRRTRFSVHNPTWMKATSSLWILTWRSSSTHSIRTS